MTIVEHKYVLTIGESLEGFRYVDSMGTRQDTIADTYVDGFGNELTLISRHNFVLHAEFVKALIQLKMLTLLPVSTSNGYQRNEGGNSCRRPEDNL